MKRRNILLTVVLVAVLVLSLFLTVETFFLPHPQTAPPEFYVGVQCGYNNVTLCKEIIDKTKNYTNLFIIGATDIVKNSTLLNEVCDYAYNAGLHFSVYFSSTAQYTDLGENITSTYTHPNGTIMQAGPYPSGLPILWINSSVAKYGDRFLGAYVYDEPAGNQLDDGTFKLVRTEQDYFSTANAFVQNLTAKIQPYLNSTAMIYTADYGAYWFDYQAGYDVVLADFGWNNSRPLQIGLCRGAASTQGKDWGVMLACKYGRGLTESANEPDLMGTGAELYNDLMDAYQNGAKYAVVFDYSEIGNYPKEEYCPYSYGILDEEHFNAMRNFWSYVQNNPDKYDSLKADVALVLPEAYGSAFRWAQDSIWGLFKAEEWSPALFSDIMNYLNEYGSRLDIVYNDNTFTDTAKNSYNQVIYWPTSNYLDNFSVQNLNTTLGYTSIQSAIDSGATSNGQVLSVKAGTYHENIVINKTVSIIGEDKATTIVDGGNHGTTVNITQNGVKLSGLTIKNSGTDQDAGIFLRNVTNCDITDNIVEANYYGIYLNYSSNNTLRSNTLNGNVFNFGVDGNETSCFINDIDITNTVNGKKVYYLINADNIDLNPTTNPNVGYLALVNCTGITVQGLSLSDNVNGILLVNTQNSNLSNNTITNCNEGLRLMNSQNNILRSNHLNGNTYGFCVQNGITNDVDTSNTLNGKPIYYWINQHDQTAPSDAGCIVLVNCSSITIQNLNLTNNYHSIVLSSTVNCTIKQNQISSSYSGIVLEDASNFNSISANNLNGNVQGIEIADCQNNRITGNTVSDNQYGAYIRSSDFNILSGNAITANTEHGLQFFSECSNNSILGNQLNSNNIGVEFIDSSGNSITQNTFNDNTRSIQIHGSSIGTQIADNTLANSRCGIEIALMNLISDRSNMYGISYTNSYYNDFTSIPVTGSHSITGNTLTNNTRGIIFDSVNDTAVIDNTVTGGDYGITFGYSFNVYSAYNLMGQTQSNNTIQGNTITNSNNGLYLQYSNNFSVIENNITGGMNGIFLAQSRYNRIIGNVLTNLCGIQLASQSYSNVLKQNIITANYSGFGDDSIDYNYNYYMPLTLSPSEIQNLYTYRVNDVDTSNTINGKPIYYWFNQSNKIVPSDAACVILVNCTNITVQNLNITGNYDGIVLAYTQNSTVTGNSLENNTHGLRLVSSSYNNITGNSIINNTNGLQIERTNPTPTFGQISGESAYTYHPSTGNTITANNVTSNNYGVYLSSHSWSSNDNPNDLGGNTIYHNNFISNNYQFYYPYQRNIEQVLPHNSWDNGVEGNYWSDYNGTDANHNGIADSPYQVKTRYFDGDGNTVYLTLDVDNYPLMQSFSIVTKTSG